MANGYIGLVNIGDDYYKIGSTAYAVLDTGTSGAGTITEGTNQIDFVVPLDGFPTTEGATVHVKFVQPNTVGNKTLTLKVGGDTAHPIINPNGAKTWKANSIISFTFDGTNWVINSSGIDASSTAMTLGNIQSDGTLQTGNDVTIAQGDKLVITDNSNGNKVARASLTFTGPVTNQSQTTTFLRSDGTWAAPTYTQDTHHQAKLIVGGSNTASANAARTATNNSIFLNLIEDSNVRSSHNIIGAGSVTVESDANGKITITGTKSGTVTSITPGDGLVNGDNTQTAITKSGTIKIKTGGVTNDMLEGSIANAKLANSSITIAGSPVSLGGNLAAATLRANLGLASALRFVGSTTTTMSDGFTGTPAGISIYTGTGAVAPAVGDVVIQGEAEYVCISVSGTTYTWEMLGRDSSLALDSAVIHNTLLQKKGDIIYASEDNSPARLAIGTGNNKFLTISGGVPVWGTVGKSDVGLGSVTNHAQVTSLQWDSTNKKITYKVSEGTATELLEFVQGSNITLTAADGTITIAGTANTAVTQAYSTANNSYPLLFSATAGITSTNSRGSTTAIVNNAIYANPSTGTLHATKFSGDGSGLTGITTDHIGGIGTGTKYLRQDGWKTVTLATSKAITSVSHNNDGVWPTVGGGVAAKFQVTNGVLIITAGSNVSYSTTNAKFPTVKTSDGDFANGTITVS